MEESRVNARRRNGNRIPLLSLILEAVVVHSPQDAVSVDDRDSLYRLLSYVLIVADHIRESVGY